MSRASFKRTARIASLVRAVLSETIQYHVKDPRVEGVTITDVEVSGDLREAKVFVCTSRPELTDTDLIEGLNKASGFLRRKLGEQVKLRTTPSLRFFIDESLDYGARIEAALHKIEAEQSADDDDA